MSGMQQNLGLLLLYKWVSTFLIVLFAKPVCDKWYCDLCDISTDIPYQIISNIVEVQGALCWSLF